jgi:hypothetical protein
MRRAIVVTGGLLAAYIGSYVVVRQTHVETWERDGHRYLIVPSSARVLYYLYRPAMYADQAVTGMRFHIGPHRE